MPYAHDLGIADLLQPTRSDRALIDALVVSGYDFYYLSNIRPSRRRGDSVQVVSPSSPQCAAEQQCEESKQQFDEHGDAALQKRDAERQTKASAGRFHDATGSYRARHSPCCPLSPCGSVAYPRQHATAFAASGSTILRNGSGRTVSRTLTALRRSAQSSIPAPRSANGRCLAKHLREATRSVQSESACVS